MAGVVAAAAAWVGAAAEAGGARRCRDHQFRRLSRAHATCSRRQLAAAAAVAADGVAAAGAAPNS